MVMLSQVRDTITSISINFRFSKKMEEELGVDKAGLHNEIDDAMLRRSTNRRSLVRHVLDSMVDDLICHFEEKGVFKNDE